MKLKDWLIENRYSMTKFAELTGYSRCYISALAHGHYQPSARCVKDIARVTQGGVTFQDWHVEN